MVDGFTITGTASEGIYLQLAHDITVLNNHVSYSGSPGSTFKQGIYVEATADSVISGNTSDHNTSDGIRLFNGCSNVTVSNNVSFGNASQTARDATGISVYKNSHHNTIIHNIVYANEDTGLNFYTGSSYNLVIGNVTYGNGDHGIDNNDAPNNVFIGNTVQGNVTAGINIEGTTSPGSGGATVINNISVDNGLLRLVGGGTVTASAGNIRVDAQSLVGTTLDYNQFYLSSGTVQIDWNNISYTSLAAFKSAVLGQEAHGLQANPLLAAPVPIAQRPPAAPYNVAINVGDYHLTAGSPAIDSANADAPSEPTLDIIGTARVDEPSVANTGTGTRTYDDRGAYEFAQNPSALQFTTASGTYVTFGDPAKLDLATFTIETWFKRTGAGTANTTGSGGIDSALPLVTHGSSQAEGSNLDANWVLAINDATDVIAADFEDMATGLNHPVNGVTVIANDVWYHAAATYDGTTWKLYLNGSLEATLVVGAFTPRWDSMQQVGLGTMIESGGTPHGYFQGALDEARVWSRALTQAEIIANINHQLTSGSGLVARWGLNEGTGTAVGDSVATTANGTITGSNFAWVAGTPFGLNLTPNIPTLVFPADTATSVPVSTPLTVQVNDARHSSLTVSFYGRVKGATGGEDFTLIAIPDPQYYAMTANNDIYNAQMNWVVANKTTRNIKYVMSLGDNVDSAWIDSEWTAAATAWDILAAGGVPYGIVPGNHDVDPPYGPGYFNTYFGSRIAGQPTYGGRHDPADYDNTYATFSVRGLEFIVLFIGFDAGMTSTSHAVLVWADGILAANPNRRAIVVTHDLLDGNILSAQGQAIYDALKDQPNLFLMLGGHHEETGQNAFVYEGRTVYALRSDYQSFDDYRSGYLRIMRFSPASDMIYVTTYSPNQNAYRTTTDNEFNLAYDMGGGTVPFNLIGSTTVPSGSSATITWSGLTDNESYEWYATSDNGGGAAVSPTWSFTTETAHQAPVATQQPNNQAVTAGQTATFTAGASGVPLPGVQWQVSTDSGRNWSDVPGATATTLAFEAEASDNGHQYRVVFTNPAGTATSDPATLSVNQAPIASGSSKTCTKGLSVKAKVTGSDGLASDPDDDPLAITNTAPAHGSATAVSGYIVYQNNGTGTSDSFDYTVDDGRGGTATATVSITVIDPSGRSQNQLSPPVDLGGGQMRIESLGIPCSRYALEYATSANGPWTAAPGATTQTADSTGLVRFDFTATDSAGYFRTRWVP